MPLFMTARCDRCQTTRPIPRDYREIAEEGWLHVRLHGFTDKSGKQGMPPAPNEWLVCADCRAALIEFLGPNMSDFYEKAGLR